MNTATKSVVIPTRGLKVSTLIPPASLPADLVPPEGQPAGNPVIELHMEGCALVVHAIVSGKSVRRALKTIAELGAGNVNVQIQGVLKPGAMPDTYILDAAGLTATPKTPKSEDK